MRVAALHTYPVKGCHRLDHDAARVEPWGLAGDRRWMIVDADGVGVTQRRHPALATLRPTLRSGGLVLRGPGHPDLDVPEPTGGEPTPARTFRHRKFDVEARAAGPAADAWLTTALGHPVRLVWLARPTRHIARGDRRHDPGDQVSFADAYPLLLTVTASLDALNGWLAEADAAPAPMARFRPNLVVEGAPAWAEDGWTGRDLRIGDSVFRAAGGCDRCAVTTVDQETGTRTGQEPLRTLARHRRIDRAVVFGLNLVPVAVGTVAVGDPVRLATDDPPRASGSAS
ncbi:MOSC domain-containing protein [Micromonospora sp. WMMD882]|uniref:MOSC domain-containing protein n=1 Tax=Micromonospora sp. WMMD882 TaxID=3015151 RepID=UPI00248B09B0|nr:MOSC N-terminal beta barrel domain-containing protein [Micromonospora sp. WMMD882]WBB82165.1 MOSC domain-containing protein [Micromonospora sp. WMMD882]